MAGSTAATETETTYSPEQLDTWAGEFDETFAGILQRLPESVWYQPTMLPETVQHVEGVGHLQVEYIGNISIRIKATPAGERLGFYKDYQRRYGSTLEWWERPVIEAPPHQLRTVVDLSRTEAAYLEGCPYDLSELAVAVESLGQAYQLRRDAEIAEAAALKPAA